MSGYQPLLPFDTDDPQFARGFEAGSLWQRIKTDPDTLEQTIHASNAEMVMRMCEIHDRNFKAVELDDDWVEVTIS